MQQVLCQLADEAIAIATEIEESLEQPLPQPGISVWTSLRHAISAVWGERKLREKSERLESIRSELQFHVIVSIKAQVDVRAMAESDQMGQFDQSTRRLMEAIMKDSDATRVELDGRIETVNKRLSDARQQLEKQHRDYTSLAVHHHLEQMTAIKSLSNQPCQMEEAIDASIVTRKLLNALWFSRMSDRFDDIKPAHKKTFQWLFTNPRDDKLATCTFMNWMEGDNGIYWVSGRAGSGKSTLMKFLAGDDRTNPAFEAWAGERTLVTARHWFWSQAQDPLQRSLDGLLRAVMHDVIQQCPGYAILLFPDQFVVGRDWTDFPTSHDLTRAFTRLVSINNPPACVALMIDGLDEYEASEEEHFDLAKILKEAARSKNFKVVVSSRPETPFETTFGDCDKLRLHELTRNDRKFYVADVLDRHWRIKFLVNQADDGEQAKDRLTDCVVEMSEGIFLWLKLVAAALAEELNTCDALADLQAVLDKFPRGLEELYRHMFQRIPERRRIKGAQIIQLVRCSMAISDMKAQWVSNRGPPPPPMSAHTLSVAHTDYANIINREKSPLRQEESEDAIRKVDYLLRSHCAGLLELKEYDERTRTDASRAARRKLQDPEVVFLHKSVVEFIDRPDTQSQLLSVGTGVDGFNPYVSLMACLLFKLKIYLPKYSFQNLKPQDHTVNLDPGIWYVIERTMRSAIFAETNNPQMVEALLDSLDQLMTTIFVQLPFHWSIFCPWDREVFNGVPQGRDCLILRGGSMLFFAVENGLAQYPLGKLDQREAGTLGEQGIPLLISACRATTLSPSIKGLIRPAVVERLLRLGADPNLCCQGVNASGQPFSTTPWGEMLHTLRGLRMTSLESFRQTAQILENFIEHGADPAAKITWTKQGGQGSSRQTFDRTAREQIRASFIDCFSAEKAYLPYHDGDTIAFVPFKDFTSYSDLTTYLLASNGSDGQDLTAHAEHLRRRRGAYWLPSESEVEQIALWGSSLIKSLGRGREAKQQRFGQRWSSSISYKLRLKSGRLGTRFAHLHRLKQRYQM